VNKLDKNTDTTKNNKTIKNKISWIYKLGYIIVGVTFALYIGIHNLVLAPDQLKFYVAGGEISPLANGMATAADWMTPHLSYRWPESFPLMAMMVLFI
jgi:hypothetical protein